MEQAGNAGSLYKDIITMTTILCAVLAAFTISEIQAYTAAAIAALTGIAYGIKRVIDASSGAANAIREIRSALGVGDGEDSLHQTVKKIETIAVKNSESLQCLTDRVDVIERQTQPSSSGERTAIAAVPASTRK